MGGFYKIQKNKLVLLNSKKQKEIKNAISIIQYKLPYSFFGERNCELERIDFYVDYGMTLETGVLGATSFFNKNCVCISPLIVNQISWNNDGVPNNEESMSTIIHELTHLKQMRWVLGIPFIILNNPIFSWFTLELHANKNGEMAKELLSKTYDNMRNKNRC